MKNLRRALIGVYILAIFSGCEGKRTLSYYDLTRKLGRLSGECLVYAEDHNGSYPSSLDLLVSSGQIDQKTLETLLNIKDGEGPGQDRRWIYSPNDSNLLVFATQPVTYTQVLDGKT